ncbi:MAG: radical SAM protein [Deltaproteobacteria bacterium]|nr:radical SAM protein [Deltaproteobacteria bacterium]MBW2072229.1 radical SAM protein [Deltaproteobacteria bacterium]
MISVGIGLTNNCNLNCAHCYRDQRKIYNLTLDDIKKVCDNMPIGSIGFGTGENGLNPQYMEILEYLRAKKIKLTLASNGYTLAITNDELLSYFGDVEFSVDFPDQKRQDAFRGDGNWQTIMAAIDRCSKLGVKVSILAVLMNVNYRDQGRLARLAASLGADFRVNVYQPMFTDRFMLSFEQYWQAYQILFDHSEILSVTEPLVNAFLGLNTTRGTPCGGKSIRITPDRKLKPCVYWPESELTIDDLAEKGESVFATPLFRNTHTIPEFCRNCTHLLTCSGGCAARRILRKRPHDPDEYCPILRGKKIRLQGQLSSAKRPLRTGSICTTIVRGA